MSDITVKHCATFSKPILRKIVPLLAAEAERIAPSTPLDVFDPFAGTGKLFTYADATGTLAAHPIRWCGVEIEHEWASQHPDVYYGSTVTWEHPVPEWRADVIVTSPCYGNRMADHHDARDASKRNTYRHTLGRPLSDGSSAMMQWGGEYRRFHGYIWTRCIEEWLAPGGAFILNISNHIRAGAEQLVSEWHVSTLISLGLKWEQGYKIPTQRQRQGANGELRVDGEQLHVFRKIA